MWFCKEVAVNVATSYSYDNIRSLERWPSFAKMPALVKDFSSRCGAIKGKAPVGIKLWDMQYRISFSRAV